MKFQAIKRFAFADRMNDASSESPTAAYAEAGGSAQDDRGQGCDGTDL